MRWIEEQIDRAQARSTLTYRVLPRLSLGVEFNPVADEIGPLANWLAVTETEIRPAVMFGLSSDRIGTPDGEAWYVTASKDLEGLTGVPVAPYLGAAWGTFEHEVRAIAGVRVRLGGGLSSTVLWDGKALHPTLEYSRRRHVWTLLWVDTDELGVAYSVAF